MFLYCGIIYIMIIISFVIYKKVFICKYNQSINNKEILVERIFVAFGFLFLWFLTAFRSINIGNDTITYCKYFDRINTYGVNPNYAIELGFQEFILLISKFTDDSHIFLILISSILYGILAFTILKFSDNCLISFFLAFFFCFSSFCNIMRQSLSIMICLIAYVMLKENKLTKFVILVLIASLFHKSSLCILLLLIYKVIPLNEKFMIGTLIGAILLSGTNVIFQIANLLNSDYIEYFNGQYAGSGQLGTALSIIRAILLYLVVRTDDKNIKETREYKIMYTNLFFLMFFLCCGFTVSLISRIANFYLIFTILDIPYVISMYGKKKKILWIMLFAYTLLLFMMILFFRPEWNHLYPYEFWK